MFCFKVADKFYELTNIRHNITSAYHPQANGEMERFNRTTQEAFLKCQEFHDQVVKADTLWHKKLHSILFTYRTRKHASTGLSPYMVLYGGRECAGCQDPILSYFILFFGKNPILSYFLGNVLFYPIFLAILPLILVFYSLFITIMSCKNIP